MTRAPGFLIVATIAVLSLFEGSARGAGLIGGSYEFTLDDTTDKTATGTTRTERTKNTLDLKYKGFLSPVIENELTFKVEQLHDSSGPDTVKTFPGISLGYKRSYWNAGAKRTIEDSNEPGREASVADIYFVELFLTPPRRLPDFKGKYTLETNSQSGVTDTRKTTWNLSSNYRPYDWLDLKGEFTRNTMDDRLRPDSDTEDDRISGTAGLRHFISEKIKLDVQYRVEKNTGATLLTAGGAENEKSEDIQTVKNLVSFRPFRDTNVDASYDGEFKENHVSGERNQANNFKVVAAQKIGEPYDLRAEIGRNIAETQQTADDYKKTEDTYTLDFKAKYTKMLDFAAKYTKKDSHEDHLVDPTKSTSSGNDEFTVSWVALILPTLNTSVSYARSNTFTNGAKTSIDTRYILKGNIALKDINLTIDPSYDITKKDDMVAIVKSETRDLRVAFTYKLFSTSNINSLLSHTYARKVDTLVNNINRTDSTSANITWKIPFPGWMLGFDVTRQATDTSHDDLPADITTNFAVKASYKYRMLMFDTSYKYDKKNLSNDSESFDAKVGWTAPSWDAALTYTNRKTFSAAKNEGQTMGFAFKYVF